MDKLLNLLNEYGKTLAKGTRIPAGNYKDIEKNKLLIISREYGFIKWLVDNNKIDRDKNVLAFEFSSVYTYDGEDYEDHLKECKLLMLLAIQDEPIEFLISILK